MIRERLRSTRLRTRVGALSIIALTVALVGAVLSLAAFQNLRSTQSRLTYELSPGAIATAEWASIVHDQLTSVYAYTATAQPTFLDDYQQARDRASGVEAEVRTELRNHPDLLEMLTDVAGEMETWRSEHAEPAIAETQTDQARNRSQSVEDELIAALRASFRPVSEGLDDLQESIATRRADAQSNLDDRMSELVIEWTVVVAFILLVLVVTWFMLDRWVLAPLRTLSQAARRVAGGDLEHVVHSEGPPEVEALSGDLESMRQRIVAELGVVQGALDQLELQAADLSRSNSELEQFAYVASHDLQEPLRKVTGFCQLLQRRYEGQLDDRADEYIAYAVDGAKRMQLLINDLLAFSRVGRTTEQFAPVDLSRTMDIVLGELHEMIEELDATVEVADLPTVWGDERLLHSVLVNLTSNALKFHGTEPPQVSWSVARVGELWELRCRDNGIGIEPQFADKVFEIFQRLHTREAYAGTGIGLAMARKVIEFHGGRIWVDTTAPGPGTTMVVTIPIAGSEVPPNPGSVGHLADALNIDRTAPAAPPPSKERT